MTAVEEIVRVGSDDRVLTREEETVLFEKYRQTGDERIREFLVMRNLRLVRSIATRYKARGFEFLDIVQEGNIGLLKAIESFKLETGNKFSTYATYVISNHISTALREKGNLIRIPRYMGYRFRRISIMRQKFREKQGRPPSIEEIAREENIEPSKMTKVLATHRALSTPVDLETPVSVSSSDKKNKVLGDLIADQSSLGFSLRCEVQQELARARVELSSMKVTLALELSEKKLSVYLRLVGLFDETFEKSTCCEVAKTMGMSPRQVTAIDEKVKGSYKLRAAGFRSVDATKLRNKLMTLRELEASLS